jgi:lipid A ethanolaminephosphotransferase
MPMWFGDSALAEARIDHGCLAGKRDPAALSQDWMFHWALGLFSVATSLYQLGLDIFAGCRRAAVAG